MKLAGLCLTPPAFLLLLRLAASEPSGDGDTLPAALQNLQAAALRNRDKERNLFLGGAIFGNDGKERSFGERCNERNSCAKGLDCVSRNNRGLMKVCLPTTCVQEAAMAFNQPQPGSGTTPFEDFVGHVLAGAGLTSSMVVEGELVNHTTVDLGEDVLKNGNYRNHLKRDVMDALTVSLLQEDARNPMAPLHDMILDCFRPHLGDGRMGAGDERDSNKNNSTRHLQATNLDCLLLNGFFVEISAIAQFLYAWGTVRVTDNDGTQRDIVVNDICFGAGTTAGAGAGYLLQLWWNGPGGLRRKLSDTVDPRQTTVPIPFLMSDIDAAVGPGIGIAWSSLAFLLINRLWFKFYIGAGGGVAVSLCIVDINNGVE